MELKEAIHLLDAYADGFLDAPYFRARIHMAGHLYDTLDEIFSEIERLVVKGYKVSKTQPDESKQLDSMPATVPHRETLSLDHREEPKIARPLRFRKVTIAQGTKALLEERGQLHGKEIEKLLKEGGYKSEADHFQSSLAVALGRDGGFENIGGNTWRLKPGTNGHPTVSPVHVSDLLTNGARNE